MRLKKNFTDIFHSSDEKAREIPPCFFRASRNPASLSAMLFSMCPGTKVLPLRCLGGCWDPARLQPNMAWIEDVGYSNPGRYARWLGSRSKNVSSIIRCFSHQLAVPLARALYSRSSRWRGWEGRPASLVGVEPSGRR
jgi:hypothetical protein